MSKIVKVEVPDIGDFSDVDIIEVLVNPGDSIAAEDALITLESDKATIEIPSPQAGTVKEVLVKVNDKVSQGDLILTMELTDTAAPSTEKAQEKETTEETPATSAATSAPEAKAVPAGDSDMHAEVVVLGSGPGGYTAAFRAADLGKKVILIERYSNIGGVCLNVGCIPSKALLHTAQIINETDEMAEHGVTFGKPKIDLPRLADFKNKVSVPLPQAPPTFDHFGFPTVPTRALGQVSTLLIATSLAARGLDVKDLNLVVNFDTPSHYEDYVHRVGRTGCARDLQRLPPPLPY